MPKPVRSVRDIRLLEKREDPSTVVVATITKTHPISFMYDRAKQPVLIVQTSRDRRTEPRSASRSRRDAECRGHEAIDAVRSTIAVDVDATPGGHDASRSRTGMLEPTTRLLPSGRTAARSLAVRGSLGSSRSSRNSVERRDSPPRRRVASLVATPVGPVGDAPGDEHDKGVRVSVDHAMGETLRIDPLPVGTHRHVVRAGLEVAAQRARQPGLPEAKHQRRMVSGENARAQKGLVVGDRRSLDAGVGSGFGKDRIAGPTCEMEKGLVERPAPATMMPRS